MNKEPELVDLELPSENLWMTHNLGASCETDLGLYYQWGSLVGHMGDEAQKHSSWETCPFNNGKEYFDVEYFKNNRYKWFYKNGLLKSDYDVVTQSYGDTFKMPTDKDYKELIDNTTSEYIENYKNTRKDGRLFISKINGKTLFIPFSGGISCGYFYGVGICCNLWSSRLYPNSTYYLNCNTDGVNLYHRGRRRNGYTIRGIKVKRD